MFTKIFTKNQSVSQHQLVQIPTEIAKQKGGVGWGIDRHRNVTEVDTWDVSCSSHGRRRAPPRARTGGGSGGLVSGSGKEEEERPKLVRGERGAAGRAGVVWASERDGPTVVSEKTWLIN